MDKTIQQNEVILTGGIVENIKIKSRLYPFGHYPDKHTIIFNFAHNKPNAWHRFWQKLLLGWVWEDEKDTTSN